MMKRLTALILMLMLLLPLVSCGEAEESAPDNSFIAQEIEFPEELTYAHQLNYVGGRVTAGDWVNEEGGQVYKTWSCAADGTDVTYAAQAMSGGTEWRLDDDESVSVEILTDVDSILSVTFTYRNNGADSMNWDGGELFGVDIASLPYDPDTGEGGFKVTGIWKQDDIITIASNLGAVQLDGSGERVGLVLAEKELDSAAFTEGKLLLFGTNRGSFAAWEPDFAGGELGDPIALPERLKDAAQIFAVEGYELAMRDYDAVWGFRRDETGDWQTTEICNFIASDISGYSLRSVAAVSADCIFVLTQHAVTHTPHVYRLTRAENASQPAKTLTLAIITDCDSAAYQAVSDFNMAHENVRFEVKKYISYTEQGWMSTSASYDAFDKDILAGDVPDVVVMPGAQARYIKSGLFANLAPLMEADGRLTPDNLLNCVRRTVEQDGKIYYLPTSGSLSTLINGDGSFTSPNTVEQMMDYLESIGDNEVLLEDFYPWKDILYYGLPAFVNFETGETDFDGELFTRFAEIYKREADGEFDRKVSASADDKYAPYREGSVKLLRTYLTSIPNIAKLRVWLGTDELNIVGHPESGVLTYTNYGCWGITADCADMDAAMELLTMRLSDEYLLGLSSNPLVTVSAFEAALAKDLAKWYYIGYGGQSVTSDTPFEGNRLKYAQQVCGEGVILQLTEEDAAYYRRLVDAAVGLTPAQDAMVDEIVYIVREELENYAKNDNYQISEITRLIDDRVSTYYNEQK